VVRLVLTSDESISFFFQIDAISIYFLQNIGDIDIKFIILDVIGIFDSILLATPKLSTFHPCFLTLYERLGYDQVSRH
jgi:hypothetical protein